MDETRKYHPEIPKIQFVWPYEAQEEGRPKCGCFGAS
uniref:Uncharacterized protein n=1 Tax=Trichinella nativa TaxID=6335 RepID=A0A0V1IJG0_9BILA